MEVQCLGHKPYAKNLTTHLTKAIEDLQIRFPKFTQHLKKIKGIYVYDDFSNMDSTQRDTMGFYRSDINEIHIASNHANTLELAIYTLFHEIGHHLVNMKMGIALNYNSSSKNSAYFIEEIRAEKYSLFIIDKFFIKDYPIMFHFLTFLNSFRFHRIKSHIISTINQYKKDIEKCSKPTPRYFHMPMTTTFTATATTSTIGYTTFTTTRTATCNGTVASSYFYRTM